MDEPGEWALLMVPIAVCLLLLLAATTVAAFHVGQQADDQLRPACAKTAPASAGCRR